MIKWLFILIFLLNTSISITSCPSDCSCTSNSIICTCNEHGWSYKNTNFNDENNESFYNNHLILSNFSNYLEYVDNVIIHSCSFVTVLNGTFSNLKVKDSIKFIDIKKLSFSSNSFKNINISPKQFIIQNSYISILPSFTFTGLGNLNHFWIRNTTINKIQKLAFSGVTEVDYLYFRQVVISHLEPGSFAQMININKFFMRDQILLPSMSEHLFIGSNFKEIIFEKGEIIGNELFLMGVRSKKITIKEMKLQLKGGTLKRIPTQEVTEYKMINCTINRISPALFYNYSKVVINHSNINSIRGIQNIIPYNISLLLFNNCKINQFQSHSIQGSREFNEMKIDNCKIEHFHTKTFHESFINLLTIENSLITNLEKDTFNKNNINLLTIFNTKIKVIGKEIFYQTSMSSLTITNSTIGESIEGGTFGEIKEVSNFIIKYTIIKEQEKEIFKNSNIKNLQVLDSIFTSTFKREYFDKLFTQNFIFSNNILHCDPNDCEVNALFTKIFPHNLEWRITENSCQYENNISKQLVKTVNYFDDKKNYYCNKPTEYHPIQGLICQRRWLIDDCTCDNGYEDNNNKSNEIIHTFSSKAKFLLIGDCKHLTLIDTPNFESLYVYFYRIDHGITIVSVPKSIRRVFIHNSDLQMSHSYAFKDNHLEILYFNNVFLPTINEKVFYDMNIDKISIKDSNINQIGKGAFKSSIIKSIDIKNSNIRESGNLLDSSGYIHIENSNLAKTPDNKPNHIPSLSTISLKRDSSKLGISYSPIYPSNIIVEKCLLIDTNVEGNCNYYIKTLSCTFEKNSKCHERDDNDIQNIYNLQESSSGNCKIIFSFLIYFIYLFLFFLNF
ncbi:Leucine rich repeat 5-containing protein [Strongyloides ratti]|uniref:Leucine rich repeat 5-containing protein n=1 Tax=Strongyloides ratti TaxID=34506 RepID=A0A090LIG5_STRRB|nr:Leucine rich repeat 5-containing protein [Strongyloides ratti]CEF67270.1 Leucine rich repeat 5-containing protein [Strongyloides ratti]